MFNFEPFVVEHISPGVLKKRSANGKLDIFSMDNGREQTVAAWADAVKTELMRWPAGYPCLLLHDLRKTGLLAFGAEMQTDFEELFQLRPDLERYVALVMPADFSAEIVRLDILVRELQAKIGYPVHWKVFTHRHDAMGWLLSKVL